MNTKLEEIKDLFRPNHMVYVIQREDEIPIGVTNDKEKIDVIIGVEYGAVNVEVTKVQFHKSADYYEIEVLLKEDEEDEGNEAIYYVRTTYKHLD